MGNSRKDVHTLKALPDPGDKDLGLAARAC